MNHLHGADRLANRYNAMRHGQSKANASGIIVSSIERDRGGDYGLTELGKQQALAAARGCGLPADTLICSSDFARALQTAQLVRDCLGAAEVVVTAALRERYFGAFDGMATSNYARVWGADAGGTGPSGLAGASGAGASGVEPAADVLDRATAFVADLERRYRDRDVLLVSHGDTLQILQAGFCRLEAAAHRGLPHLDVAEVRPLRLALSGRSPSG